MRTTPIYVELDIAADMDAIWSHTQEPNLHRQWDLRFTDITYLPKEGENSPQRFLYRTRIGFGIAIAGTGESRSSRSIATGGALSTLVFESEQPISLIRRGGGYWRYKPDGDRVTFSTKFNYTTRFGIVGRLLDRLAFRPLFGYATAWSFDMLRIWLERGIAPAVTIQRAVIHYACVAVLSLLWLYEGLLPKLISPDSGELQLYRATGLFPNLEHVLLPLLGVAEIGMGIAIALWHRRRAVYVGQSILLVLLGGTAIAGTPELLLSPFNPLVLTVPMLALAIIAAMTASGVPMAGRCRRRNEDEVSAEKGGGSHEVYL
ncbi:hypothetical protein B1748_31785 [Paenibacillus sp. MY03]|uniref:DoxX-like family protein n=1 Tax=Paenibacillus sp. MY03 TaxID=302980 RepID=UPI000B3CADFD|nr:DoxX-like family protein [Paenibacillus sp. MY03]OUS69200.1 hypothetical protein B1748_31785 [Paenibacillus sp. MY03]